MDYFKVTIHIAENNDCLPVKYNHYNNICANLQTAIKCANHFMWLFDIKPLNNYNKNKWEIEKVTGWLIKYCKNAYITIEQNKMWEKPGD